MFGPGKRSAGPGIGELIGQVTQDGKAAIKAEIDLYKAIAVHRASGLKIGVHLLIVALFVLQAVVTAIFVGVLFALAGWIGAGWATLATAVLGFALVGLLAWLGIRRARTLFAPIDEVTP